MLAQARALDPQDPGTAACKAVEDEIAMLLQATAQRNPSGAIGVAPTNSRAVRHSATGGAAAPAASLEPLRAAMMANPAVVKHVGEVSPLSAEDPAELWATVQRLLLRLPAPLATQWREEVDHRARQAHAVPDPAATSTRVLPFHREELLYPGLKGAVQVPGLQLSTQPPLDPRVAAAGVEPDDSSARIVSFLLAYIPLDRALHHALKSVYRFGIITLKDPKQRNDFEQELIYRFRRVQAGGDDPAATLRAWLDLDEASHSLIYDPPVARDSWWGKLQQEMRDRVAKVAEQARAAGCTVHLQALWGRYDQVRGQSDDNVQLSHDGAPPGQVLACLRQFAKIDGEELPGRVIYRPLT